MKQLNYLFVTIEGGGNIPPMFGLMKRLILRGHTVNVLTEPCLEQPVNELAANFIPFTDYFVKKDRREDMLQDWNATLLNNPIFKNVIFGPAATVVDQTINAAKALAIDILVVDMLLLPALMAGEVLNIPKVLVFHMPEYMPGPNRPPGNMGLKPGHGFLTRLRDRILGKLMIAKFDEFKRDLNKIRVKLQLPLLNKTVDLMDMPDFRILQTLESFDFPIKPAPKNVRYTGPILDDPDWVDSVNGISSWIADKSNPLVVISFSSTFQNQSAIIQNCIYALQHLDVRGLVTLGLAMEDINFEVPENVKLVNSVKHSMVFPHADVVITHAGHGTVMRALASGVPLICLPMGRDQLDNAVKVEMKGCGIKLPSNLKPKKIKIAIEKILNEPEYKANATKLKRELLAPHGMEDTLLEIENMANMYKNKYA